MYLLQDFYSLARREHIVLPASWVPVAIIHPLHSLPFLEHVYSQILLPSTHLESRGECPVDLLTFLSVQVSPSSFHSWQISALWILSPWSLEGLTSLTSTCLSIQGDFWALFALPIPVLQPGNSLGSNSETVWLTLFVSILSVLTYYATSESTFSYFCSFVNTCEAGD